MIRTLYAGELRHHLRDRLTVVVLVLGQGVAYPLLGLGLAGLQRSSQAREDAVEITIAASATDIARLGPTSDRLVPVETDLQAALDDGAADAGIRLSPPGAPFVARVLSDAKGRHHGTARTRARRLAEQTGQAERRAMFEAAGATDPARVLPARSDDTVPTAAKNLRTVASTLPALLMVLVAIGGVYTALDVVTGEKERGTAETLLTTSARRRDIALAKFLTVLTLVVASAFVSLTSLFLTARLPVAVALLGEGALPARVWLLAMGLFLPLAAMLAAILTAAAATVADFKSGQVYTFPALLIPGALAAVAMLPDATLTPFAALIPITNLSIALKEVLLGTARTGPLLLCLGASAVYTGAALVATTRWLGREDVLLGDRGGRHRRLRGDYVPDALAAFAFGLALLWFVAAPAQQASFVWGMALTQLGLFAPLALATPAFLGLKVRETLALHAPRGRDLLLGVAAGGLSPMLALIAAEAQKALIPASPASLALLESMIPPDLTLPVMLAIVALAPGICEELLFRGAIQGLLGRSLRPAVAAIVTACAFGLFHLSVFRILPTAVLGLVFGFARARTGTVVVGMVAHAVNNGLAVTAGAVGVEMEFNWLMLLAIPAMVAVIAGMGPTARPPAAR